MGYFTQLYCRSSIRMLVLALVPALVFTSAACLSLRPSLEKRAGSVTPTPVVILLTATAVQETPEPTRTATSTATPIPTETPVLTPTPLGGVTPTPTIIPFTPPFSGSPSNTSFSGPVSLPGVGTGGSSGTGTATSGEPVSWNCNGDEKMTFLPETPHIGEEVLITVSSAGNHGYTLMLGPKAMLQNSSSGRSS